MDTYSIGKLLLETRKINKDDYDAAVNEAKATGRTPHEILVFKGKVSIDELVQAITIHVDTTLLKEALAVQRGASSTAPASQPYFGSFLERISMVFKMGILMSRETNMSSLVDLLLRQAPAMMNAERATIFLADYEREELYSHVGVGLRHDEIRIPWHAGIAGWVFTHHQSVNVADAYDDVRFNRDVDQKTGFRTRSLLCVPLQAPGGPVLGAFEVLNKRAGVFTAPDLEILEILASQAARAMENAIEWDKLRRNAKSTGSVLPGAEQDDHERDPGNEILGHSMVIQTVRSLIRKVAPTDTTVLIQGESGTGKELVARAIHRLSLRTTSPLMSLNCAAIPAELIESELFGHKKGAFTGSIADHKGVFRSANKGTLFLDEIEAMSPAMQVKLLRAIQEGEIKPVGESVAHTVDVRLIAATNRDLVDLVRQGGFREDLFYRINVFPIIIPPLRDRTEDIPVLCHHFLTKISRQTGKEVRKFNPAALDVLTRYPWPGNVRELENEIERAQIMTPEGTHISIAALSPRITGFFDSSAVGRETDEPVKLKEAIEALERKMVFEALERAKGNRSVAAKHLGLSRQGLINKLHRYGFEEV